LKNKILNQLNQSWETVIFFGHSEPNILFPELSTLRIAAYNTAQSTHDTISICLANLMNINWSNTENVFLIGCQTAVGKSFKVGNAGIQQRLVSSGVTNVVATLWQIDSNFAIDHFTSLLKNWHNCGELGTALQRTQLEGIRDLMDEPTYMYPHPYFWASYTLMISHNG
jgi:CHAT domain-containing protein